MRALAALTLASGSLSGVRAQPSPDYQPFDPTRIGSPALTESEKGIDALGTKVKEIADQIAKAKQRIADLQAEAAERAKAGAEFEKYKEQLRQKMETVDQLADERSQKAIEKAEAGKIDDLSAIRDDLTVVIEASRLNALLGNEEKALKQQQAAVNALEKFSSKFSETCSDQSFDPGIALGLERQNQMHGTGIDLTPCAKRRHTIEYLSFDNITEWKWKNCSMGGEGEWVMTVKNTPLKMNGTLRATVDSTSAEGTYTFQMVIESGSPPIKTTADEQGDMKVIVHEERAKNGTLIKRDMTLKLRATHTHLKYSGTDASGHPFSGELTPAPYVGTTEGTSYTVKISGKPCKSLDE